MNDATDTRKSVLLCIDCSQRRSHIVLSGRGRLYAREFMPSGGSGRDEVWDELRALSAEAGVGPAAFDAVAVAVGPGGFTGLRVSIALVKALAYAHRLRAVAVPSAAVFAASDRLEGGRGPWLVALASKSGTAWCSCAAEGQDGSLSLDEATVDGTEAFRVRVARVAAAGGVLLADEHLAPELAAVAAETGVVQREPRTHPAAFASEACRRLAVGDTVDPFALAPIYAREPEAVTKWRAARGG